MLSSWPLELPGTRRVAVAATAALSAVAWHGRFVQDDAFISFRYADHLARGLGLVYNPGERVEGFTNLLFTLAMALSIRAGIDPIGASYVLGLACFAASLLAVFELSVVLTDAPPVALAATVLLGAQASFSAWATGGMETSSQAALFALASWLLARGLAGAFSLRAAVALSTLLGLALWTRLDSAPVVLVAGGAALHHLVLRPGPARPRLVAGLALPFAVLTAVLVAFKLWYFGALLPNTFHAKVAGPALQRGASYLTAFGYYSGLAPVLCVVALAAVRAARTRNAAALALYAMAASWVLYVLAVGGDFMEFRMVVPALPIVFALLAWTVRELVASPLVAAGLALGVLYGSARQYALGHTWNYFHEDLKVETVRSLHGHVDDPVQGWRAIGLALRQHLHEEPGVTIALGAAGAVPYFSGLRTVDMYGLTDPWVARHGLLRPARAAGHQRAAPCAYLLRRGVNLVLHRAAIVGPDDRRQSYTLAEARRYLFDLGPLELPADARVIELPFARGRSLRVLYLVTSPALDRRIARNGWRQLPIVRPPA